MRDWQTLLVLPKRVCVNLKPLGESGGRATGIPWTRIILRVGSLDFLDWDTYKLFQPDFDHLQAAATFYS